MKILLRVVLICLLFSINQVRADSLDHDSISTNTNSHITVYPVTEQGKTSIDYELTVNGIVVPVEKIEKYTEAPVQYALMDFDGLVKLNFELTTKTAIQKYAISPKREKIDGAVFGNKLKFQIKEAQYMVVKIEGLEDLFILIDTLNNHAPVQRGVNVKNITDYPGIDPTGHENSSLAINKAISEASLNNNHPILYFPQGTYLSGEIKMKDNVTIYLAGGAVIQATNKIADYPDKGVIYWDHVINGKLTGRGIVEGNGTSLGKNSSIHIIEAVVSQHCLVDGITERDSPFWTNHIYKCKYFDYKNIKIINNRPKTKVNNSDGLNFDCSSYCSLHNGFFYTGDDNCVVKGTGTGSAYNVHHIVFDKYIGYSNSAACKIGTETTIDTIDHVLFTNVDIIRCDRALAIDAFDNAKISNVDFRNIYVEDIAPEGEGNESSKFIDFLVTRTGWRESAGKTSVKNISVKNVTVCFNLTPFPSEIKGVSQKYDIDGVTIQNLKVIGPFDKEKIILNPKQADMETNSFVYHLTFKK